MKTLYISLAFVLLTLCVYAQQDEDISIGKKQVLHSRVLKEERRIWVYTPSMTAGSASPAKRYPVLYLLDGDAHFYATVGIIQQLSQANGNGVLPEMIVVAIENTNRLRDLVPAADLDKTNPFINFLSSELIPYIDKNYNTAPYKLIVGHSLGGLTVIDMLTRSHSIFNAYIAIDPSMWYDNERFLKHTIARFPKQDMNGKRLFVGTANTLPGGMTMEKLKMERSNETKHIRSILELNEFLKTNMNGLLFSEKYYATERHNTVPLVTEYDGLKFIFDFYDLKQTENDFADTTALIASTLKKHYAIVSEKMGYKNSAPETLIDYLAYEALGKDLFPKAKALYDLNIAWYPGSYAAYVSYANYFLARQDTINAIAQYKAALKIEDNEIIQKKLVLLTKQAVSIPAADLQRYTGIYNLEMYNIPIVLEIRNKILWAKVPGQEDDEFQLLAENIFTVKGKHGYTITFHMDGNKPTGFTSVQPNGIFKATFKSNNSN